MHLSLHGYILFFFLNDICFMEWNIDTFRSIQRMLKGISFLGPEFSEIFLTVYHETFAFLQNNNYFANEILNSQSYQELKENLTKEQMIN